MYFAEYLFFCSFCIIFIIYIALRLHDCYFCLLCAVCNLSLCLSMFVYDEISDHTHVINLFAMKRCFMTVYFWKKYNCFCDLFALVCSYCEFPN
jgi:hypothetical protein